MRRAFRKNLVFLIQAQKKTYVYYVRSSTTEVKRREREQGSIFIKNIKKEYSFLKKKLIFENIGNAIFLINVLQTTCEFLLNLSLTYFLPKIVKFINLV